MQFLQRAQLIRRRCGSFADLLTGYPTPTSGHKTRTFYIGRNTERQLIEQRDGGGSSFGVMNGTPALPTDNSIIWTVDYISVWELK